LDALATLALLSWSPKNRLCAVVKMWIE